ncbi:MAG: hypothetical protein WC758_08285 [Candidatus Woesearchaeota archaeon]|jgi:hypothetical protein
MIALIEVILGFVPRCILPSSPLKKHIEIYRLDNKRETNSIGERSIQKDSIWDRA